MSASLTTSDLPSLATARSAPSWWARPATISVALAVAVLIPYLGVWHQQFINFDDNAFVTQNLYVRTGFSLQNIRWAFSINGLSQYHPLAWLSYMADVELFGTWPGGFKLHNVALHIANVVLLFHFLRLTTRRLGPSALVAAIFGLHPQRVEAVAWIAERKEVLSTFFGLWTLIAYWWYTQSPSLKRYAIVFVLFVLTLMSKPMLVTLPCVLLLLDYWPLNRLELPRTYADWKNFRGRVLEKLPLFVPVIVSSYLTVLCQKKADCFSDWALWPLACRIGNSFIGYAWYIRSTFIPVNLSIIDPLHKQLDYGDVSVAVAVIVLITWLIIRLGVRRKYLYFGWFFFLGTLVPVIGIVQVGPQRYADRYSYLPCVGLLVIVAWAGAEVMEEIRPRLRVIGLMLAAALAALTLATYSQVRYWDESLTIFGHAVDVEAGNALAMNNLGVAYLAYHAHDQAMACFHATLAADPDNVFAIANIADNYSTHRQYDEAVRWYLRGIGADPSFAMNYGSLGSALLRLGRVDQAITVLRQGIELAPDQHTFHESLGVALETQEKYPEALREFETAVKLSPDTALTRVYVAMELLKLGRVDDAVAQADRAVQLDPREAATVATVYQARATRPASSPSPFLGRGPG